MIETRRHSVARSSKKKFIPLLNLRTSEVVRTVVDHPRRLEELLNLLQDQSRLVRERAGATLARLSESHPGRLVRVLERIKESLADDSAYVRWHLIYTLGRLGSRFPQLLHQILPSITSRLEDENGIARAVAARALRRIAQSKSQAVAAYYSAGTQQPPAVIAQSLQRMGVKIRSSTSTK